MSNLQNTKMNNKPKSQIASKIPTSGRDSGTHSRSSSVSNLTTASDIHSEQGDATSDNTGDFKIDDRVWVNGTKPGIIKFIGKTQFAAGIWTGILLDEPVGKNDGCVAGVKYFTCEPLRGIFARPGKLTRTAGAESGVGDSPIVWSGTPKSGNVVPSSRSSVTSSSTSPKFSRLRVGDRITVSSISGLKSGTLRFVGETDFAKGEWAGIELDEPTGKNDGSVAGKRYFNCPMKYGLFAPLHKVSKPGMTTPVSRPGSVRGTPLMRSNSRESMNSSISNTSRTSRVKLGVTSLTSAQKSRISAMGITTTSKALQEALKEKEQHIEQLLKERDLDRAEFARLTSHFEEIDNKSSKLEKAQKDTESDKKDLEEKFTNLQRRFEDLQFQLEEEKIAKSDFEAQLRQRSQILKRIEELVDNESGENLLNIREILLGQEVLSKFSNVQQQIPFGNSIEHQEKIVELEAKVASLSKEKQEMSDQLTELQKWSSKNSSKNDSLITSLNTIVQEKDDMITNLRNELNSYVEQVTQLIEENKNLNEQMLLNEKQAKGHADDVIKELGEKINSLSDELKTKSSQLTEHVASVQDKDNKIATLEHSLSDETAALIQLQNEYKNLSDTLKQKKCEYEEKVATQKSLEETIVALKSQLETDSDANLKKITLLEEEIKTKSRLLNDSLSSMEEKDNLISSLQQNFDSQVSALLQLQTEKKNLNDSIKQKDLELGDKSAKIKSLEEQIITFTAQNESTTAEKEKKMIDLVKEIERLTNCAQEKEDLLLKTQSELTTSQSNIEKLNEIVQQLSEKVKQADAGLTVTAKDSSEKINQLQNELSIVIQDKSDLKSEYEKEIDVLKTAIKAQEGEVQAKNDIITQHEYQISLLSEKLKKNEEEISALKKEVETAVEKNKEASEEKLKLEASLKEKDEAIADLTKEVESLKKSIDKNNSKLEQNAKELQALQDSLNLKEEENNQLTSKLQLAEQKVDMLNKDSSDHVISLQNELSKIKEESTTTKTHLEQELVKIKKEQDILSDVIKEKDTLLLEGKEALTSLENQLKEKETKLSDLMAQNTDLSHNIAKCNADIEETRKRLEERLTSTLFDYELKLSEKEEELLAIKNEIKKLSSIDGEKEKSLLEKEGIITTLQSKLKDRESEISDLSTQNADLLKNIAKFSSDIEEEQKLCREKLSSSSIEFDNKLKEKDQVIQNIQNEIKKYIEILDNKAKEIEGKDSEINVLKNVVKEKDYQFDELSKMVEASQSQLSLLKEQNEKNLSLLESKESLINNFKSDQEKQLLSKEQLFKEETAKLESLVKCKDEEIETKQTKISNLSNEIEDKKKLIECLQKEVEEAKTDKEKLSDVSSNVYQELNSRISEMEEKYSKLLEEKEKIAKEELQTRDAKKNLELVRDSLIQEKSAQEEMVKDREAKLQALQADVNRMQAEFSLHKQELQQKLDVSKMELEAALELKNQLVVQHSVLEELQQELQNSDEKCKKLEAEVQIIPVITSEKNKLQTQVDEYDKVNKERSEMITKMEEKHLTLDEQLKNNKNLVLQKEKELSSLKEQLQRLTSDKDTSNSISSSLKSLEEENLILKNKISLLELQKVEKKTDTSTRVATKELSPEESEERESLLSQIDFLNSIIVDMKQKNEELTRQLEAQTTCWEDSDVNLNETKKAIAPRLFCDICDMFDEHETCDCPKQESFADDEEVPQLRLPGTRQLEERPYCNNCEVFGHWTLDCDEPDTF